MKIAKRNRKHCRTSFGRAIARLTRDEQGAVAMEYIVIALLVAAAVIGLVMVFSGNLRNMLGHVNKTMTAKDVKTVDSVGTDYNTEQDKMAKENDTAKSAGNKLGGDFGGGAAPAAGGEGTQTNP